MSSIFLHIPTNISFNPPVYEVKNLSFWKKWKSSSGYPTRCTYFWIILFGGCWGWEVTPRNLPTPTNIFVTPVKSRGECQSWENFSISDISTSSYLKYSSIYTFLIKILPDKFFCFANYFDGEASHRVKKWTFFEKWKSSSGYPTRCTYFWIILFGACWGWEITPRKFPVCGNLFTTPLKNPVKVEIFQIFPFLIYQRVPT